MRTSFHHQPEAQHPNFQLSTSWQADYPIFRGEPDIAAVSGRHAPECVIGRRTPPDAEPRESPSARLEEKLLKQPAQFERRAIAAVRHRGRRDVALAIDLPADNGGAARSRIALRAALSLLACSAALALARQQLPAGTRAETRRVLERDEAAAVESDDVKTVIACALVERAAHGEAVAG